MPEALTAQFMDLVQYGQIREDWAALYNHALGPMNNPEGSLVGKQPPANAAPARPLTRLRRACTPTTIGARRS